MRDLSTHTEADAAGFERFHGSDGWDLPPESAGTVGQYDEAHFAALGLPDGPPF